MDRAYRACIAAVALLLMCISPAAAQVRCDMDVRGLDGWSAPSQAYWHDQVRAALLDRLRRFQQTGRFEPSTFVLNGNIAAVTSGHFERERIAVDSTDAEKVPVAVVQGTDVPIYDSVSRSEATTKEAYVVRDMAYRLPVRIADLPRGARETLLVSAQCLREIQAPQPIVRRSRSQVSVTAAPDPKSAVAGWRFPDNGN